ncbi:WSSV423 [White spot syndrome virus]|nr:WSSV423 [White spot syndrome virus]
MKDPSFLAEGMPCLDTRDSGVFSKSEAFGEIIRPEGDITDFFGSSTLSVSAAKR